MGREDYRQLYLQIRGRAFHTTLFARPHVSKGDNAELPAGQTLFVLNVPATATEKALSTAFSTAGEVKAVQISSIASGTNGAAGTRAAHVAFASPSGLKKALALRQPMQLVIALSGSTPRLEQPATREQLQRSADSFMKKFDAAEKRREAEEEARHNTMDDDGFVLVTRKRGRSTTTEESTGATVGVASTHHGEQEEPGRKKKKKKGELLNFYHFQQHEKKREQLAKLREQFEADKARIAKMKQERKFKPHGY